jgi:hypothetical protein
MSDLCHTALGTTRSQGQIHSIIVRYNIEHKKVVASSATGRVTQGIYFNEGSSGNYNSTQTNCVEKKKTFGRPSRPRFQNAMFNQAGRGTTQSHECHALNTSPFLLVLSTSSSVFWVYPDGK